MGVPQWLDGLCHGQFQKKRCFGGYHYFRKHSYNDIHIVLFLSHFRAIYSWISPKSLSYRLHIYIYIHIVYIYICTYISYIYIYTHHIYHIYTHTHIGVSINGGWFIMENPLKWMIWGSPIPGNLHIFNDIHIFLFLSQFRAIYSWSAPKSLSYSTSNPCWW